MRAAVGWSSSDSTGRSVDPRNPAFRRPDSFPSPAERRRALAAAVAYLRCPVCAGPVYLGGGRLACGRGHSFDIARHGYANLTAGRTGPGTADTTAMVAARDRFLSGGHYQPLAAAVRSLAAQYDRRGPGLAIDLAGGTGYYLARTLDALPHRHGVCIDLSVPALRRAALAHRRAAALGADVAASPARRLLGGRGAEHLRATQRRRDQPHPDTRRHPDPRPARRRPPAGTYRVARHDQHRPAQAPAARRGVPRLRSIRRHHPELPAEARPRRSHRAGDHGSQRPPHHAARPGCPHPSSAQPGNGDSRPADQGLPAPQSRLTTETTLLGNRPLCR